MIELLLEAEGALSIGLLDRAEILYRQVAGADPRNSIAVVGLARVTLERGDEPGALKLARRALAIDPENTAAQRMVQRLEEVLSFREAALPPAPRDTRPLPESSAPSMPVPEAPATGAPAQPQSLLRVHAPPQPLPGVDASPQPLPPHPLPPHRRSLVDRLLRRR